MFVSHAGSNWARTVPAIINAATRGTNCLARSDIFFSLIQHEGHSGDANKDHPALRALTWIKRAPTEQPAYATGPGGSMFALF